MTSHKHNTFKPDLLLIDGSNYLFRAFYALPQIENSKGMITNTILGVLNAINSHLNEFQPQYFAVVFDPPQGSFRNQLYNEYKSNRAKMDDNLKCQIEPLFELIRLLGIKLIIKENYEADDVIATIATQAAKKNLHTLIFSSDKDLAQLVNSKINIYEPNKKVILDALSVQKKFKVTPSQIIDYLTLVGDVSDNIPGVYKCGAVTASKWLATYKNLENLISNSDAIKGKVAENLNDAINSGQLQLAKTLVTLRTDVILDFAVTDLVFKEYQEKELLEKFSKYELNSWKKKLINKEDFFKNQQELLLDDKNVINKEEVANNKNSLNTKFIICNSVTEWQKNLVKITSKITNNIYLLFLKNKPEVYSSNKFQLAILYNSEEIIYLPNINQNSCKKTLQILENSFANLPTKVKIYGYNLKPFLQFIYENKLQDLRIATILEDLMLQSYCLNSTFDSNNLEKITTHYLNKVVYKFEFQEIKKSQISIYLNSLQELQQIFSQNFKEEKNKNIYKIYYEIENPLASVLADMEITGVNIDTSYLLDFAKEINSRINDLETKIYKIAGKKFNLNSSQQLAEILVHELGIDLQKKTATGKLSTNEETLSKLAIDYPIAAVVLSYRGLIKLKSAYVDNLIKMTNPYTNRIHTTYLQTIAQTGRLSSINPNLQNIPIKNKDGRRIREAFTAPENYKILSCDYSQIELRIMAELSQDKSLLNAFSNGLDIHTSTASEIFNLSLLEVTNEHRRKAKAINFGLIYGMSAFGLSKQIGVSKHIAQNYIEQYFDKYPSVLQYMNHARKKAKQYGYVETLFHRKLYLPAINSSNFLQRQHAERAAINAPMQGTSADLIKLSMLQISKFIKQQEYQAKMIMQVHDELVFEVNATEAKEFAEKIKNIMEQIVRLKVPLIVEYGIADNWNQAH